MTSFATSFVAAIAVHTVKTMSFEMCGAKTMRIMQFDNDTEHRSHMSAVK